MHLGNKIKDVLSKQGKPVTWLANQLGCERTNVYNIFARKDISTGLLQKICIVLGHDFFKELSEETFRKR
ncbi:MAG: XRE family transcriptional regulator [Prevotella sp.]|nr:XRE family transcriptional regulator [Prevotella sp.]